MTDPITTAPLSLSDKWKLLVQMASTWVAFIGAALVAAPIDWTTFDFTQLSLNKCIAAAIWFLIWCAARVKAQPSVTP